MINRILITTALLSCISISNASDYNYYSYPKDLTNTDNAEDYQLEDNRLKAGVASLSAIANIPGLAHEKKGHGHTGIGVGFGAYENDYAIAIGIEHHQNNISVKTSIGLSDTDTIFGIGSMWTFH